MSRMDHRKPARRVRRRFSDEFKEQTVRLVLDDGKSVTAVAGPMPAPCRKRAAAEGP
jgi:transposase-like protein